MNKILPNNCEFETKYYTDIAHLPKFKKIIEGLKGLNGFTYAEGPDMYWTKPDESFARYRRANHEAKPKAWLTMKWKPEGAINNIKRKEINWLVTDTPFEDIKSGVEELGFEYNFKIWKMTHVYYFEDATLAFYTVKTDRDRQEMQSFIEIEVSEELIKKEDITEDEAYSIIRKYEVAMEELGITAQHRVRKSLYELYRRF